MSNLNNKPIKEQNLHFVKIPKALSHYRKDSPETIVYHFSNVIPNQLDKCIEELKKDIYQDTYQARIVFNRKFEELLRSLCRIYNLSIREIINCSIVFCKDNPRYFSI
jgi:hypothetical protein